MFINNKIVKGRWDSCIGPLELFICYDIFTCAKKINKMKLTLKTDDTENLGISDVLKNSHSTLSRHLLLTDYMNFFENIK